jgi:hypothetical protein
LSEQRPRGGGDSELAAATTLVVAFSSLGWSGLVRAEWGATLRRAAERDPSRRLVVAHALDTSRSWFTTDPMTGAYDDGAWWDAALTEVGGGGGGATRRKRKARPRKCMSRATPPRPKRRRGAGATLARRLANERLRVF